MQSIGNKLLSSLIVGENIDSFLKMDLQEELFLGVELELFKFVNEHVIEYGVLPKGETIALELGDDLPKTVEPPEYYYSHIEKRYLQQTIKKTMLSAQDHLKVKDPDQALSVITETVLSLALTKKRKEIVNFKEKAGDILHADYLQQWLHGEEYGVKTGWDYLDDMTGTLQAGDVMVISARPGKGKTYMMLNMAHHAWEMQGKVPMFVSMEMKPLPLVQRISAIHTSIPVDVIKTGLISDKHKEKLFGTMNAVQDSDKPPFWIIDGNLTATVEDIELLARQLKPDVIFVDGAYMLKATNSTSKWEKIAGTIEDLKQKVAGDLGIPVVATYQFNRSQEKAGKSDETGLHHIGGSDAIGQIASIVVGLFDEEGTPVEKMIKKTVSVLKGRNGESGEFDINWLFSKPPYMNFDEIPEEMSETAELQFM